MEYSMRAYRSLALSFFLGIAAASLTAGNSGAAPLDHPYANPGIAGLHPVADWDRGYNRDYGQRDYDRNDQGDYRYRQDYGNNERWRSEPRVTLYEGRGFRGRAFDINRPEVRNFEPEGFNDRAESMRIEQGHWLVCSDAELQGQCRTFGPGEYPSLPPELDHRISSARMVDNR